MLGKHRDKNKAPIKHTIEPDTLLITHHNHAQQTFFVSRMVGRDAVGLRVLVGGIHPFGDAVADVGFEVGGEEAVGGEGETELDEDEVVAKVAVRVGGRGDSVGPNLVKERQYMFGSVHA